MNKQGEKDNVVYYNVDSEKDFEGKVIKGTRGYCFLKDKLVIVYQEGHWTFPGGSVEKEENVRDATRREVKEETNMKVVKMRFIGLQEVIGSEGSVFFTRVACIVEPEGNFVADPSGEVEKIELVDPTDHKKYITYHWDEMSDKLMERALEAKRQMQEEIDYIA